MKNRKKGFIALGTIIGISAVATAIVAKDKIGELVKEKIIEKLDSNEGENIYVYEEPRDNRYQQTLMYRRNRVNKKPIKGIDGQKFY